MDAGKWNVNRGSREANVRSEDPHGRTYGVDVSWSRVNVETTEVVTRLREVIVKSCKADGGYLRSMAIHTMSKEGSIESMSIEEIVALPVIYVKIQEALSKGNTTPSPPSP